MSCLRWFVLVVLGSLLWIPSVFSYSFLLSEQNGREYHWKRAKFPLLLSLHGVGSKDVAFSEIQKALQDSVSTWNQVKCSLAKLSVSNIVQQAKLPGYDGINVVAFIQSKADWPGTDAEYGKTVITYDKKTGEILDADLLLNDWNYQWGTQGKSDQADLQAVLTHELGHFLGLDHSSEPKASMYFQANLGEITKRNLVEDDTLAVCDLYPLNPCKEGALDGNEKVCFNGRYTSVCSNYHEVCKTCSVNTDCKGDKNFCIGIEGGICGFDCSGGKSCPAGYTCLNVEENEKVVGANCVPDNQKCQGRTLFPCCRDDGDCLTGFSCVAGSCKQAAQCKQEGDACNADCCGSLECHLDAAGSFCRMACAPLSPRCNAGLRCKSKGSTFSQGICIPPSGKEKEEGVCQSDADCEYEFGCHPQNKRCYLLCRVGQLGSCPTSKVCVEVDRSFQKGLCLAENGQQSCQSASDCATGKICKQNVCSICTSNSECPTRHQCLSGFCRSDCSQDKDCPTQHRCLSQSCQPGISCKSNADCSQGLVCFGSICTVLGNSICTSDSNCGAGQQCILQQCQWMDPCNNQCKDSEVCSQKKCIPRVCKEDVDCGEGWMCRNQTCLFKEVDCGGQGACTAGKECIQSKCLSQLGYPCRGDEDCVSRLCVQSGSDRICSQNCLKEKNTSCPDIFICADLEGIGTGCWPSSKTECIDGNCKPKKEGCSCSEGTDPPFFWLLVLFLTFPWFMKKRRQHVC